MVNNMSSIYLPIDTKSLYYNIFNDNKTGHTCTVATPIRQGSSTNEELMQVYKTKKEINLDKDPEINDYLNKSSKSTTIIKSVFLFDKFSVNGIRFDCDSNYCMFIKEEIDPNKYQFGRTKLHYPISAKYDGYYSFDNKKVISKVSSMLYSFAFIVRGFEYIIDTDVLNFDVDIIGYKDIPYSKVFINNKGVGNKHTANYIDIYENYDFEILGLRDNYKDEIITTDNYFDYYLKTRINALGIIRNYLHINATFLSLCYPYSFYDMSFYDKGIKKYIIVFFSTTKEMYFNISMRQYSFINAFKDYVEIYNITNIYNGCKINKLDFSDLNELNKTVSTIVLK